MALILSGILFAVFVGDVVIGATSGSSYLSDVQQMLVLFAASIAFTVAILRAEGKAKAAKQPD
ncbi:hypothetical protein [Palleronia caenipelagi]|uniref:Uncharacterized protein n=1 Tax=Palleronia caenipelagi TaxID=2489174 RepID=A0A547Q028_9RHOB|nr:hypothetical protein [Palleronia caenipelagi]TRD19737.1 hypothetical protein FEV53_10560 [Palleronia caenipelagi]